MRTDSEDHRGICQYISRTLLDEAYERTGVSHFSQGGCPKDAGTIQMVCVFPLINLVNPWPCDTGVKVHSQLELLE